MSAKVLGRITQPDQPRGPDVEFRLSIPEQWLVDGATLEIELPRNLTCAGCRGGGCDACERSGAVSLRGRQDPIELVEVTLPKSVAEDGSAGPPRPVLVRVPDQGGLPAEGSDLPRGHLLLAVSPSPEPTRGVARLERSKKLPEEPEPPRAREPLFGGQGKVVLIALGVAAGLAILITWLAGR